MLRYCRTSLVKQCCYSILGTPNSFFGIHYLYALFFRFCLKYQEFCRTVSYFKLICHNRLNHFLYCHTNRKVIPVNSYIVILKLTRCSCAFLFYLYTVKQFICWSIAQHRFFTTTDYMDYKDFSFAPT